MWEYSVKEQGKEESLIWRITGVFQIRDESNKLINQKVYQVETVPSHEVWYLMNYDGFICKYVKMETGEYKITRLLPESAIEDYNWISNNITFIITDVSEEFITIEMFDNLNDVSGYYKYRKNVGPCEIYINDTTTPEKHDKLAKLVSSKIEKEVIAKVPESVPAVTELGSVVKDIPEAQIAQQRMKEDEASQAPESSTATKELENNGEVDSEEQREMETATSTSKSVEKVQSEISSTRPVYENVIELKTLLPHFYYVQVGSFMIKNNALHVCSELKIKGYNAVLIEDKDGFYKVLIEGKENLEEDLEQIRNEINSDSFVKKRVSS